MIERAVGVVEARGGLTIGEGGLLGVGFGCVGKADAKGKIAGGVGAVGRGDTQRRRRRRRAGPRGEQQRGEKEGKDR